MKAATLYMDCSPPCGLISIHAAREGGDELTSGEIIDIDISIHAAREGGDGILV